jgi:actin-related protein
MSADEMRRASVAPGIKPVDSFDAVSVASGELSESSKNLSHHDKEVQKLIKKREKLDQQLAKKRLAEEAKVRQSKEKDEEEAAKYQEKMERELKKTEEKHKREVEKLEQKKAKEERKAEEKRKKKDDQTKLSMVTRERDDFRSQTDLLKQENALLQAQVAELQGQNNAMAQKLGKEALASLEAGRSRSSSLRSTKSEVKG